MGNDITYTAFVDNIDKNRTSAIRFHDKNDAVKFIKEHMRRKIGSSYMPYIERFNSNFIKGYRDKNNKFYFYIVKFTEIGNIKVNCEPVLFEL